jgi:hypothetical protein
MQNLPKSEIPILRIDQTQILMLSTRMFEKSSFLPYSGRGVACGNQSKQQIEYYHFNFDTIETHIYTSRRIDTL